MLLKIILFVVYCIAGFGMLFTLMFQDEPGLSQSIWLKFLPFIFLFFCISVVASLFLPLNKSYIAPLAFFVLFVLGLFATSLELKSINDPKNIAAGLGYQTSITNFLCTNGNFFSIDDQITITFHRQSDLYKPESIVVAKINNQSLMLDPGLDAKYDPGISKNTMVYFMGKCKNAQEKSLHDLYLIGP